MNYVWPLLQLCVIVSCVGGKWLQIEQMEIGRVIAKLCWGKMVTTMVQWLQWLQWL